VFKIGCKGGWQMSVNAIDQLAKTEEQADEMLNEAKEQERQEQEKSDERIARFQEEQDEIEDKRKQEIREKYDEEFRNIQEPLNDQTQKDIKQLQTISTEMREKALGLIINKVVNTDGN